MRTIMRTSSTRRTASFWAASPSAKRAPGSRAEEYGHSYARELNYLTVHGVLHCLGYDHETEEEKREMREEEEKIMARMGLTR